MIGAPRQLPPQQHQRQPHTQQPYNAWDNQRADHTNQSDSALDESPLLTHLVTILGLVAIALIAVLSVLTLGGVSLDNKFVGTLFLLGGITLFSFTVYTMYNLARFFFNAELSGPRLRQGDRQRRMLTIQVAIVLEMLYFVAVAAVHVGIFVLDNDAWSNIADVLQGTTNYWQLYWIALLDSVIAAIGAASATRFVVQTVAAQMWLIVGVYIWRLETILLFTNVVATEFQRRERRRDLDPETF